MPASTRDGMNRPWGAWCYGWSEAMEAAGASRGKAFAKLRPSWWQLQVGLQTGALYFWLPQAQRGPVCDFTAISAAAAVLLASLAAEQTTGEHAHTSSACTHFHTEPKLSPDLGCTP